MKMRRVDFWADEWLTGTAELAPFDRGVYITICSLIWSRGERIGIELLYRHCGVHGNALNASLKRLENARKIVRNGSEIGQKRAENELETARKRHEKWSENLPESKEPNGLDEPPARARSARVTRKGYVFSLPSEDSPPLYPPPVPGRGKKRRLSPIEGIAKGFADALAQRARDRQPDYPADVALLDDQRARSAATLDRRGLA